VRRLRFSIGGFFSVPVFVLSVFRVTNIFVTLRRMPFSNEGLFETLLVPALLSRCSYLYYKTYRETRIYMARDESSAETVDSVERSTNLNTKHSDPGLVDWRVKWASRNHFYSSGRVTMSTTNMHCSCLYHQPSVEWRWIRRSCTILVYGRSLLTVYLLLARRGATQGIRRMAPIETEHTERFQVDAHRWTRWARPS